MELNHLKIFYEVALRGGFTAAARSLKVSQPALSRALRLLEESEGVRLLERGKKGVTLTGEGRVFFDSCARIFGEVERLKAAAHGSGELTGSLSLAASDNLCNYVLPQVLPAFLRTHPKLRLHIYSGTSEQILGELREQRAELGLFYTEPKDGRAFEWKALWKVEFVAVCAPSLAGAKIEDLGFLGSRQADYAKAYPALTMLRAAGIEPRTTIETNNQETQKKLALAGLGFTLVPRHMVAEELRTGALRRLRTPRDFHGQVFLVSKRSRPPTRASEAWRAFLKKADYRSF